MSDLEEMRDELDDITRLFTRSSKEAFKMKSEIMGMNEFVEGKNILSLNSSIDFIFLYLPILE